MGRELPGTGCRPRRHQPVAQEETNPYRPTGTYYHGISWRSVIALSLCPNDALFLCPNDTLSLCHNDALFLCSNDALSLCPNDALFLCSDDILIY